LMLTSPTSVAPQLFLSAVPFMWIKMLEVPKPIKMWCNNVNGLWRINITSDMIWMISEMFLKGHNV
jgi:hypothetical protein